MVVLYALPPQLTSNFNLSNFREETPSFFLFSFNYVTKNDFVQ